MINNIYIFRDDGICLFTKKYGSIEFDEHLISGFLTAISHFGSEIGTTALEKIDFGDYRIVIATSEDDLITAGVVDKDDDTDMVAKGLEALLIDFKFNYGDIIYKWKGDNIFVGYEKFADEIIKHVSAPEKIIKPTTNLALVTKQMRDKFAIILEVIASGKPLIVCSESREDTELYVHTLAELHPQTKSIPWTEEEEIIFSLKERSNIVAGLPLRYVIQLAEEEELSIINLAFFRVHSNVRPTKYWKDTAKYAFKNIEELGDEGIYKYIQSRMQSLDKETS